MSKITTLAGTLAALSLATGAIAAEGDAVPKRKPGAWEIITVAPVSGMTKSTICVGEDDDLITPSEGDCTKPTVTKLNEGLTLDVLCTDAQGNKQTISASFVGNFDERYSATLKTTFDPPIGGIPHMGVKLDGRYLGPDCPAEKGTVPEKK
jgi:hypothetical protein